MSEFWLWNNKFRLCGVLLGVGYHVVMFMPLFLAEDPQVAGYRWMFTWYMPSFVMGFPWSVIAFFIPGGSIPGLIVGVCLNGYLLGWPVDAIVNHHRRQRRSRIIDSYLSATPNATAHVG